MTTYNDWSDAELWDYLQERFGFGDWDEATSDVPFWKFRGNAIGQLKAMKRKRRVTNYELVVAANYVIAHHKPVIALWQLFGFISEAMAWRRKQDATAAVARRAQAIEEAVVEAMEAGETDWAERLLRVGPADAQTVINQWRNR